MRYVPTCILIAAALAPGFAAADTKAAMARAKAGSYDATGDIACAQEVGEALGPCTAAVSHSDTTALAVKVTFPNGFARYLTFEDGAFLRGNVTMSGVGTDTDWQLTDGLYQIRVDDQRFEIPQALLSAD